jgi:hypothetical protein
MSLKYEKGYQTTLKFVENSKLKIDFIHLYSTILKREIKEIVLSNGEILQINYSILSNKQIKCETVYKTDKNYII